MTDDQLKEIFSRHKMDVLTLGENWKEVRPLVMDLINSAPLARVSQEDNANINRGRFHEPAALEFARELLNIAQIKRATALDDSKIEGQP